MQSPTTTSGNAKKVARLQEVIAEMLSEVLRRDFHGTAIVELHVNDGTIQNIVRTTKRFDRG